MKAISRAIQQAFQTSTQKEKMGTIRPIGQINVCLTRAFIQVNYLRESTAVNEFESTELSALYLK